MLLDSIETVVVFCVKCGGSTSIFRFGLWGSKHDSLFSLGVQRGIALCNLALHDCRRGCDERKEERGC